MVLLDSNCIYHFVCLYSGFMWFIISWLYATNSKYVKNIETFMNQINLDKIRKEMRVYYDPDNKFEKGDNI